MKNFAKKFGPYSIIFWWTLNIIFFIKGSFVPHYGFAESRTLLGILLGIGKFVGTLTFFSVLLGFFLYYLGGSVYKHLETNRIMGVALVTFYWGLVIIVNLFFGLGLWFTFINSTIIA